MIDDENIRNKTHQKFVCNDEQRKMASKWQADGVTRFGGENL